MRCVVCGNPIVDGNESYASSFEKIRKMFPCCDSACTARFDPDQHWIPGRRPTELDDGERARMIRVLRTRLANGDNPTVVIREMLAAGLPPRQLRLQLGDAATAGEPEAKLVSRANKVGLLGGLFGGRLQMFRSRDKRDPDALGAAVASIEFWERAFPHLDST